jgi:hypothetical protein
MAWAKPDAVSFRREPTPHFATPAHLRKGACRSAKISIKEYDVVILGGWNMSAMRRFFLREFQLTWLDYYR